MTYDISDDTPCSHCRLKPIVAADEHGELKRVDACFEGAILGGYCVSGCCGHGDISKAYVRLAVSRPDGSIGNIDLCGFVVQPYGAFLGQLDPSKYPPKNKKVDNIENS